MTLLRTWQRLLLSKATMVRPRNEFIGKIAQFFADPRVRFLHEPQAVSFLSPSKCRIHVHPESPALRVVQDSVRSKRSTKASISPSKRGNEPQYRAGQQCVHHGCCLAAGVHRASGAHAGHGPRRGDPVSRRDCLLPRPPYLPAQNRGFTVASDEGKWPLMYP